MKKSKRNILYLFLIAGMTCFSQTTTENWIKTTIYKQATTTSINNPTPSQATVQVSYFDGLGRLVQVINHAQSNTGLDIIQHISYDALGREATEYLPFTDGTTSLDIRLSVGNQYLTENDFVTKYNAMPNYQNTPNPFSKKEFESSPLNRILKQATPGTDWALGSGHEIKFNYQTNGMNEVRLFTFNTTYNPTTKTYEFNNDYLTGGSYYPENQLYKTITRDENATATENSYTIEYKNKLGQVVLKRVRASTEARTVDNTLNYDTYYIYDDFGNLSFVLPPLVDTTQSTITSTVLDGLCYQYKYDYRNRLVAKRIPGKTYWEFIVYDKLDRVRATGPTASPFSDIAIKGWLYTKYDVFDRPVLTGWKPDPSITAVGRVNLENSINGLPLSETKTNGGSTQTVMGVEFHYNNVSYPNSSAHTLTINYYDNYNYSVPQVPNVPTTVLGQNVKDGTASNCKTLVTGSWARILEQSNQNITGHFNTIFYKDDQLSSPIKTVTYYPNGGYTKTEMLYDDFEGKVLQTVTKHRKNMTISLVTTIENFTYTPQGRLITNTHKINTDPIENIVTNEYKELGELKTKHVGQSAMSPLQIVDYTYNIRRWLTGINDITNLSVDTIDDLFAFSIKYNDPETGFALYNGNISETYWRTDSDNMVRKYSYEYDGLNRLLEANYRNNDLSIDDTYNEHLSYDKNGNISSLERNGGFESSTLFMIDNLVYNYDSNNLNQLKKVVDLTNSSQGFNDDATGTEASDTSDDYDYDQYGNMTKDENKDITLIKYNHLNLPTEIQFTNNRNINYTYDASGVKLKKEVNDGTYTTVTDYLDGYQYEEKDINIGGRGYCHLLFFPHAEGYVKPVYSVDKTLTPRQFSYVYNYTDHLGNIRMSYAKVDGITEVLEENHYYPFGLKHQNYNDNKKKLSLKVSNNEKQVTSTVENPFKYKFQGQERQDELGLNWDSFKWRNYDYAIGRFMSIDPLTEDYRDWAPYVFSGNRVIDARELEGLEPHSVHKTLDAASKNFSSEYNGLSIRMNGEIGTVFYSSEVNGETVYSYTLPVTSGPDTGGVDPYISLEIDTEIPDDITVVGDNHTHGDDANNTSQDDKTGKLTLDGDSKISKDGDFNGADKKSKENKNYQSSYVTGPNGTISKYTPNGSTGKRRYKNVKTVSTNAPSSKNSTTRKNNVSANKTPQVLPHGIEKDNFDKQQ